MTSRKNHRQVVGGMLENLRLNHNSYDNGLSTMTELHDAELLLQQSRDKYVSSYAGYQSKFIEY